LEKGSQEGFMDVNAPAGSCVDRDDFLVVHTASITEPYHRNSYRELGGFDYKKAGVPQFFVHHVSDPCVLTTYRGAKSIAVRTGKAAQLEIQ
jgi:hypothetical protein